MLQPTPPRPLFGVALAVLLCAAPAAGAERGGVRVVLPPAPVKATEDAKWLVPIKVINDLDAGIFGDSLSCDIDDLDPGITRSGRRSHATSNALVAAMRSLGRSDSTVITYSSMASCERARLTFHLFTHTGAGEQHESVGTCEVAPGLIWRSFPSQFIDDKGKRIETVLIPEPWPRGSSPGVLLVHSEGSHARRLIPLAWNLANAGYTVMLVSLPGYGQSAGAPDFGGPATVHALNRALDALRRSPQVDSGRIAVWGISRGATAAALLAAERHDLSGLVLESGVYDPQTAFHDTKSDSLRRALQTEGKTNGGWSKRSALRVADRLKLPVLLMHGDQDTEAVANQAVNLAGKLRSVGGGEVQLELVPGAGHALPSTVTFPLVKKFLQPILGPSK